MIKLQNNYKVYMHITPSGKRYIGITCRPVEARWEGGKGYKSNEPFFNAIKKYGWDNIQHIVLYEGLTKEQACEKEVELISQYHTSDMKRGYNLTSGGEHYEFSDEVKKKMRKPRVLSDDQRAALAERGRDSYQKYLKGFQHSEDSIRKMAATKRGRKMSTEEIAAHSAGLKRHWEAVGGFSEEHRKHLSEALKGRTFSEEAIAHYKAAKVPEKNPRSRRVLQIKNGEVIKEYPSARSAMRETGIDYTSIVRVCNGVRLKHAGGYEWRYKD